jgi:hypothetical protein
MRVEAGWTIEVGDVEKEESEVEETGPSSLRPPPLAVFVELGSDERGLNTMTVEVCIVWIVIVVGSQLLLALSPAPLIPVTLALEDTSVEVGRLEPIEINFASIPTNPTVGVTQ